MSKKPKRIIFNDDKFIATIKDGMIVGRTKDKGAHNTVLLINKQASIHHTEDEKHTHLATFSQDKLKQSAEELWNKLLSPFFIKKQPKWIRPINDDVLTEAFNIQINGRSVRISKKHKYRPRMIKPILFSSFLKSTHKMGITSRGSFVFKGRSNTYLIPKKRSNQSQKSLKNTEFIRFLKLALE